MKVDFGGAGDILFEQVGRAGIVTLSRPASLNAINHGMVSALARALSAWEADTAIERVIIRGEGRAFSAGGDILDVYRAGLEGEASPDFFADEYRLNAAIARFPKPYIALIDGIVMGGGVGVSFHGSHRVMTENAVFAMPEVGIGFFPDVGGSHLLSRLPGELGMYLALTGNRIRRGDACAAGLATHSVDAGNLSALTEALCETDNVDGTLSLFAVAPEPELNEGIRHAIARHFSFESLTEILDSLSGDQDDWAHQTLATIEKRSPTSLCVAFRQVRAGAMLEMDECMTMEFRILNRMLAGHDFYEGIRAVLVEKGSTPRWQPETLGEISEEYINSYFAPLPEGELKL
ncbi:enoyl-CoA hydratase/isomerase family protein [Nitratireductor kimnyeongensis]|uniref:3-hydroxyisobutyryl-CoA hydrolase n=1 Tax=Nitratireductor kimnyeongensis TaxID=430679 RepID=A0ABW0T389_9HYPH|nr:enoyl-CoA hydratase/isomerase family protein [Nitratireductor kimnyeongensis]QZZ35195.1 enoyl-CoA hydratase/isomerase family protein [Nitratireductor kimnyeongensis]